MIEKMTDRVLIHFFLFIIIVPLFNIQKTMVKCEFFNRPPYFVPGSGDMARFSLSENTPTDSPVYQLRGN